MAILWPKQVKLNITQFLNNPRNKQFKVFLVSIQVKKFAFLTFIGGALEKRFAAVSSL